MKKAYTMMEILIAVVIAAGIAALALPNFLKSTDKKKADQAIAYLRVIRTAQRMYHARNSNYYNLNCNPCTPAQIKNAFGAEVATSNNYTFSVTTPGDLQTFSATATGSEGTIILKDDGTWDSASTSKYKPAS